MSTPYVPHVSVLKRAAVEPSRRPSAPAQAGREFKVLQSSRAPAQLSLFPRSGALDVK